MDQVTIKLVRDGEETGSWIEAVVVSDSAEAALKALELLEKTLNPRKEE